MNKYWEKWVKIVKKVVSIQSSVILFLIFYILILPIGLFLKTFSKKSLIGSQGKEKQNSYWITRDKVKSGIIWARAQ